MTTPSTAVVNNKGKDLLERWYTPRYVVRAHMAWTRHKLGWLSDQAFETCVDPCAGDGRYAEEGRKHNPYFAAFDIAPEADTVVQRDALVDGVRIPSSHNPPALAITNPPFSKLLELMFVLEAEGVGAVSLLLPFSALGGQARRDKLWVPRTPDHVAHVGRISFEGPAKDMRDAYARSQGKEPSDGAMQDYVFALWGLGWASRNNQVYFGEWLDLKPWEIQAKGGA